MHNVYIKNMYIKDLAKEIAAYTLSKNVLIVGMFLSYQQKSFG